jgi:uncharacterized protein
MRIVLDTNVLISALISRGVCSEILEHCAQHHTLITSQLILDEVRDNLASKFRYGPNDVNQVLDLLESRMILVSPVRLATPVCRDPDDDVVLATAIAGAATCIVSGDKDVLAVGPFHGVDIVSPRRFSDYEAGL